MVYRDFAEAVPRGGSGATKAPKAATRSFSLLVPEGKDHPGGHHPSGPYHINHFICAFELQPVGTAAPVDARVMTHRFLRHFSEIFSQNNIARVALAHDKVRAFEANLRNEKMPYGPMEAMEFNLGGNIGDAAQALIGFIHPDYVGMERFYDSDSSTGAGMTEPLDEWDTDYLTHGIGSFCGNTLYRTWDTALESALRGRPDDAVEIIEEIVRLSNLPALIVSQMTPVLKQIKDLGVAYFIEVNRHHFLAGTRSWLVGHDKGLYFVETAAVERSSLWEFSVGENLAGSRDDINSIWEHLLRNFIRSPRICVERKRPKPLLPAYVAYGYKPTKIPDMKPYIHSRVWEPASKDAARTLYEKDAMVKTLLDRHPGLLRHLQ